MMSPAVLSGWGRTAPSAAEVSVATSDRDLETVLAAPHARGIIARGLGRSYGDAAHNAGGRVVDMTGLDSFSGPDATGCIRVGAGTSIDALLRAVVPQGWFVPVTPGTRFVTVGGAIAADVHGKNHHCDGSLASYVESIRLRTVGDGVVSVSRVRDPGVFWATVGGMGLTGFVVDAVIRLIPIESSRMTVDTERVGDLDEMMARMLAGDAEYRYSVAWLDVAATGSSLGRGVLTRGEHATVDQLSAAERGGALDYALRRPVPVPRRPPDGLLRPSTIRMFNRAWFHKAPRREVGRLHSIPAFFHPLDGVEGWNRLYGRPGFVQYQFVVPDAAAETVRRAVGRFSDARIPSFLTVLKRFGPGNDAPLSFPMAGWTLSLDIPTDTPGLGPLLDELDDEVVAVGGRVYLAKDSRMRADHVRAMYPRIDDWRATRERLDPDHRLVSDQSRRLGLVAP